MCFLARFPRASAVNESRVRGGSVCVSLCVSAVGSDARTQAEIKKKWSDITVGVKRRIAANR